MHLQSTGLHGAVTRHDAQALGKGFGLPTRESVVRHGAGSVGPVMSVITSPPPTLSLGPERIVTEPRTHLYVSDAEMHLFVLTRIQCGTASVVAQSLCA